MDARAEDDEVGLGLGFGWVAVWIALVCNMVWGDLQKCITCRGGGHVFLKKHEKIMHVAEKWTRKP